MSGLTLRLFGPPRLEQAGGPLVSRRKALALLAYLAVMNQPYSRDALATLFWPEADQSRARASLRRVLSDLNKILDSVGLALEGDLVELSAETELWLDVSQFRSCLAACEGHPHPVQEPCADCLPLLRQAADLYRDDFLAGFTLADCPDFDEWQFFQAENLRQSLASVLERLARSYTALGEFEGAIPYARRWLALDPLDEPAQRQLMQLYAQAGQPAAALRQYEEYAALLEKELGVAPEAETQTLYEAIKARRKLAPVLKSIEKAPRLEVQKQPPPPKADPSPEPVTKLGRYQLLEEIGRGGFATVYRAYDLTLERRVALKALSPHLLNDQQWLKRFDQEAKIIARLDHPHIVPIYDVGQAQEQRFLVMRLVEGSTLAALVAARGRLPWAEAVETIKAVAGALDYAHTQGILHRDLKPANILIDPERGPLLSDFGLAKPVDGHSLSQKGDILGTPHYLAPEMWDDQPATPQADIYALACVLYEIVTGEKLFSGKTPSAVMAAHFRPLKLPDQWPADVPPGLTEILKVALAPNPKNRYTSAGEMVQRLASLSIEEEARNLELKVVKIEAPDKPAASAPPHNLPSPPAPFIGRNQELMELVRQLQEPACRLLTLIGPGGIGKSRLALQAARSLLTEASILDTFKEGILFVPLAPVNTLEGLISAIAEAANLTFYTQESPRQQLLAYLQEKQMLLILDNFEQFLTSPPAQGDESAAFEEGSGEGLTFVSEVLATAPGIKILVTSREALNLQEAWFYPLGGLSFPEASRTPDRPFHEYDAVRLFDQCARRALLSFSLDVERIHVERICRLVGGMPLAIELAAAWLKLFTAENIAHEIERNLDILSGRQQNLPARHRSIRAILEQSWALLADHERNALQALSLFRAGFRQDAAEQVARSSFMTLGALAEKSLIHRSPEGRYTIHELIRQYGHEKLQESGEADRLYQRYLNYYLKRLEEAQPRLGQIEQAEGLAWLESEYENLQAGLEWAMKGEKGEEALHLALLLAPFWSLRGYASEGYRRLTHLLSLVGNAGPDPLRAQALHQAGSFAFALGDQKGGQQLFEESLSIYQALDNRPRIADLLLSLGDLHQNHAEAYAFYERSLAISKEAGYDRGLALSLDHLATLASGEGRHAQAAVLYQESLAIFRRLEDNLNLAGTLRSLGIALLRQGDYKEAHGLYEESLAIFEEFGAKQGICLTLTDLGDVALLLKDYEKASSYYKESLVHARALENKWMIAWGLENLARIALEQADLERAATLFAAAEALFRKVGLRLRPDDQQEHLAQVAATRSRLGEPQFAVAFAAGERLTWGQAVTYALEGPK